MYPTAGYAFSESKGLTSPKFLKQQQAMKANKTTLSVRELQKTIGLWKSRKITDSTIPKLLDLYLGVTAYMNEEAVYPVENFYDLSLSLKFKNARFLVEAVRQSSSFGIVPDANVYGMKSFYSYLWKEKGAAESLPENLPQKDIYNNISTKDIPIGNPCSAEECMEAARHFFHLINENPAQKAQVFTPLINRFQQQEGLAREDACANLVHLVNELLVPHFAGQARFMKSNHTGRLCWLNNLLKSAHGQRLLNDAAAAGRLKREQALREMRSGQRNNHPLCEFEWTDAETGMRFYDDPVEGMVNIPDDASPRPAADSVWNVLSNNWGG